MTFLIQQTLIYAVPLMIVALAGVFAERSGIINLALEGIMIFGAFAGVLFVNVTQKAGIFSEAKAAGDWVALQGFMLLAMLVAAILGAVFSLLLSFASVNLKADQTIGGKELLRLRPQRRNGLLRGHLHQQGISGHLHLYYPVCGAVHPALQDPLRTAAALLW